MRKNYFAKLGNYLKNVYHIERGLNKLSDGRVNPTYSTNQVIQPVLFSFLLRIKSFNELSFMIKNHEFRQLFSRETKLPQLDAIRDTLKVIDLDELKLISHYIVKTAVENKTDKKIEDGVLFNEFIDLIKKSLWIKGYIFNGFCRYASSVKVSCRGHEA